MSKHKILVVVAHPDDESLWFYGGLKRLSKKFNVDILCLTFSTGSKRGQEVLAAAMHLSVNVIFANLLDGGRKSLLDEIEKPISAVIQKNVYELIITHPPRGAEKSHPHYVQCFHVVRRLAAEYKIRFGFFSDIPLMSGLDGKYRFCFRSRDHFIQIFNYYKLLFSLSNRSGRNWQEIRKELSFVAKEIFKHSNFYLFSFYPNIFKKRKSVSLFSAPMGDLVKRKNFLDSTEYLYLQKR